MSEPWTELRAAALVGTARRAPSPPEGGAVGELLAGLPRDDRERLLLAAAGTLALRSRAGRALPTEPDAAPEPAQTDDRPPCSAAAESYLAVMLGGRHAEALPEWLEEAGRLGRRVRHRWLPELLELGRARPELQPVLIPLLGPRGAWLARRNREWAYACRTAEDDAEHWATGERSQRRDALHRLRARDPEPARTLLEEVWSSEGAAERAVFLGTLRERLGPADEPFLEAALEDRSKEVRLAAADLLARLPGSALTRRMEARALPLLSLRPGTLGPKLEASPPAALTIDLERDGVRAKAPSGSALGARAGWLRDIVAATPLEAWERHLRLPPDELIRLAAGSDWVTALLDGWAEAAARQRDRRWAETLLTARRTPDGTTEELLRVLEAPVRERIAARYLRDASDELAGRAALAALDECPGPWGAELTRELLRLLRERVSRGRRGGSDYDLRRRMPGFGARMPVELLEEVEAGWPENAQDWPMWSGHVDELLALLRFRRDMLQEMHR
ncbi:MAG: DUF5691 domain-containing protein [Armatimonadota bacterium]